MPRGVRPTATGGDAPLGLSQRPGRALRVPHWCLADAPLSVPQNGPRALNERQRGLPRPEAAAHLVAHRDHGRDRARLTPLVAAAVRALAVVEVDGRAALAHGHQLVKLERQRVSGWQRRVYGEPAYPARLAERPHAADERVATGAAAGVSLGHSRPPSSRACRAAYMYHTGSGAGWCWMMLDDADFSAPRAPTTRRWRWETRERSEPAHEKSPAGRIQRGRPQAAASRGDWSQHTKKGPQPEGHGPTL